MFPKQYSSEQKSSFLRSYMQIFRKVCYNSIVDRQPCSDVTMFNNLHMLHCGVLLRNMLTHEIEHEVIDKIKTGQTDILYDSK